MDLVASGETIAVVVRVQQRPAGAWAVCVERANCPSVELPLAPATFVVRLWRDARTRTLRGTLELAGSEHSAPVQSNEQIIEMALAWLDRRPGGEA